MLHQLECPKRISRRHLRYTVKYSLSNWQDKTVIIWTQNAPGQPWQKQLLKPDPFPETVWRVSWSLSGAILAVSSGDNKVTLWREGLKGDWENVHQVE
jgi:protein transport protein SEC13